MPGMMFHLRRRTLSHSLEAMLRAGIRFQESCGEPAGSVINGDQLTEKPGKPEDFRPLENACFQNPYAFYKLLRDDFPVYKLPNGIYCISRYQDIVAASRDHANYSSNHQGVIGALRAG